MITNYTRIIEYLINNDNGTYLKLLKKKLKINIKEIQEKTNKNKTKIYSIKKHDEKNALKLCNYLLNLQIYEFPINDRIISLVFITYNGKVVQRDFYMNDPFNYRYHLSLFYIVSSSFLENEVKYFVVFMAETSGASNKEVYQYILDNNFLPNK